MIISLSYYHKFILNDQRSTLVKGSIIYQYHLKKKENIILLLDETDVISWLLIFDTQLKEMNILYMIELKTNADFMFVNEMCL